MMAKAVRSDDLTRIKGVGPHAAKALHAASIRSFQDVASTSADELADVVHGKSSDQIVEEDWKGQAAALAAAWPASRTRRHTFTVTVEVDAESRSPVRCDITHVPTKDAAHESSTESISRRGWDPGALVDFVAEHSALDTTAGEAKEPVTTKHAAKHSGASWLHTFDLIEVDPPQTRSPGSFRVWLELEPSALELPSGRKAELNVGVLSVPHPIGKSIRVGSGSTPMEPGAATHVEVECEMPEASGAPAAVSALVEVVVHDGRSAKAQSGIPASAITARLEPSLVGASG